MISEVQAEFSAQVVLPNGESRAPRVLVDLECQAVQSSAKYGSPEQRRLLQADNETPLLGGKASKKMSKFNLHGLWMVVFYFLVLSNMACPRTFSVIYLGIWFWGTHVVLNIV